MPRFMKAVLFRSLLFTILVASLTPSAVAVTFNLVYRGPGSASPDASATTNPNDPNGTLLAAQMQEAANEWADIVEDSHTMTINYFYAGLGEVPTETANAQTVASVATSTFPNRTTIGEIKFYDGRSDWWFDPTPQTDSEFSMGQTLLGDLTSAEQTAGFNLSFGGEPLIEVGHRGTAPQLGNIFDVLSVARHEIGHLMGVTSSGQLLGAGAETLDGDYDFDAALIGGAIVAAKTHITGGADTAHLEAVTPLMSGFATPLGTRFDISAADVFAAAAVGEWTNIDLKRQDYLKSSPNFADPANWEGNQVPGVSDFAAIRHGGSVGLATSDTVGTFLLAEASTLSTGPHTLNVQGDGTLGPTTGIGTARLTVLPGGKFSAKNIYIKDATLALAGGQALAPQGSIDNDGRIEGRGSILYDLSFTNNGTIAASGGTLAIEEAIFGSGATIDLDGSGFGSGVVEAVNGSLDINVGLAGASGSSPALFSGTMTIGPGRFIEVNDHLRQQNGVLLLDGSASQTAEYRGPKLTVRGDVFADRLATIDAEVDLISSGEIQVPQSNDTLTIRQDFSLLGGDLLGAGNVVFESTATIGFGSIDVGDILFEGVTTLQGATVEASQIDASQKNMSQSGGRLVFEKFIGKLVQTGGVIEVGQSLITGNLLQNGGAPTLEIEIGSVSNFSQLTVTQDADLDGLIDVSLTGGFIPLAGQQFPIVLAGQIDIDSLQLVGSDAGRFTLSANSSSVVLQAIAFLAGDYNNNGVVDAADYTVWRDNFGAAAGTLPNDPDGGTIGNAQYNSWVANFGANSLALAVPEPTSLVLLAGSLVFLPLRAKRVGR